MVRFDKLKIVTKSSYIAVKNYNCGEWRDNRRTGIKSFVFNQKQPFNLFIQLIPVQNKAIIEFTSKILGDDYPKLISIETINDCLKNINRVSSCELQVENIINDSVVISCDITADIPLVIDNDIKDILVSQITNLNKFHVQKYSTTGYTITKQVKTKKYQIRLSIYDKYRDLLKSANSVFLNSCNDGAAILNYFVGKYRIESNLKTFNQIREFCGVENTNLMCVLQSDSNPLVKIFDTIFTNDIVENPESSSIARNLFDYQSLNQLRDVLLLEKCGNDLEVVESVINHYYAQGTNKRKIRLHFKKLKNDSIPISPNRLIIRKIRESLNA